MIALAAALLLGLQVEDATVLTKARIITVSGEEIPEGSVVVVNGRIQQVGATVDVPQGAKIVVLAGKTVIPGLIDGGCTLGVAGPANEDGDEVAPQVRIADSLDPRSPDLARARGCGVTAAFVEPGNRGVIGGTAAVIRTSGTSRAAMILREDAAIKAAIGPGPSQGNYPPRGGAATFFARRPTTRMGVAWEFKKAFFDARRGGERHSEGDPGRERLLLALAGKLPVRIAASRGTDLETAMQLADELGLTIVIEEAQEAHLHAEALAKRKIPVLLRPSVGAAVIGVNDGTDLRLDTFGILIRAGVRTALLAPGEQRSEGLLSSVAFAVRYGADRRAALRAVTLTPAEILGVSDRMGSLDAGKDADLVVLSGDPADLTSRVERVMIGGRWVSEERADR